MPAKVEKYYPTFGTRQNELIGMSHLSLADQSYLKPIFLLSHWKNSGTFEKSIEWFESKYPDGDYFLDLDQDAETKNWNDKLLNQWNKLNSPINNFGGWKKFYSKYDKGVTLFAI